MQVSPSTAKSVCVMNVDNLYRALEHPTEASTWVMETNTGIKVVGKFTPCEACIMGKPKQ